MVNPEWIHPTSEQILSSFLFSIAVIHTFLVNKLKMIAHQKKPNSLSFHFWHLISEVEIVFGFWSFIFLTLFALNKGITPVVHYLDSLNFSEPAFVFVIMCIASTRPVLYLAENGIKKLSRLLPFQERLSFYLSTLILGPVLGSLITEPAAMTITAMILLKTFYKDSHSLKFKYATMALLFVNISIGGTMTSFAAPPVLMVASKWHWNTMFMISHFGLKSLLSIFFSTSLYAYFLRKELRGVVKIKNEGEDYLIPRPWKILIHLLFLMGVVVFSHHPQVFIALFFLFIGFMMLTQKHEDNMKIKESLFVSFFLAGLICLGTMQAWWLNLFLSRTSDMTLFFGATALTSITDNAILTYLGSLVPLSDSSKYSLVAGAIAGGGLTVMANAPNPVGFKILENSFGDEGINPLRLFLWALIPTGTVIICFIFL